jgi:hypothetical protein
MIRLILLVGASIALPSAAIAQPWAEAYKAGDYGTVIELLQEAVIRQQPTLGTGAQLDAEPARLLADFYGRGVGVAREPVLACGMAMWVEMALAAQPPKPNQHPLEYLAMEKEREKFVASYCRSLGDRERLAASWAISCPMFGFMEESFAIGEEVVHADRFGLHFSQGNTIAAPSNLWCPQLVARLAPRVVSPPADAAPGVVQRTFIELWAWEPGHPADGQNGKYFLSWTMFEILRKQLEPVLIESGLMSVNTWPGSALPSDFDARFSVEMIRSGHIRWRVDGAPPKRGWIMLPDKVR